MIAKIYQNTFSNTVIYQILDIASFEFDLNLSQGNRGTLKIPLSETFDFETYQKIEIYDVKNGQDILIFGGYIFNIEIDLKEYVLNLRDENDLMNKKLVLSDKTYNNNPGYILNDLITGWNTETGETWQVVNTVTENISIEFKQGDNLYKVLNELATQLQYNWKVEKQNIYFGEVGENKTVVGNFFELVYNGDDPSENNLTNIKLEYIGDISNLIIGSNSNGKILKKETGTKGALGEFISLDDGTLADLTQNYLDIKKQQLLNYIIELEDMDSNIFVGDKVYLRVEKAPNPKLNYDGPVLINSIKYRLENAQLIKTVGVETQILRKNTLKNRLEKIERDLQIQLLK